MKRRFALAFVIGIAACTSGPSADTACSDVAAARCERLQACSASDLTRRYGDLATCETRLALGCRDSLAAPDTGASPDTVTTCADSLPAESCPDFLGKDTTDACLPQMGTLATGTACTFNAQCASSFCAVASDATCGTCQATPVAGASCADAGCGPDLRCVASTQLCQAPVAAAGACSDALPCANGLACVGADPQTSTMGSCVAEVATAGATCDPRNKTGPDCDGDAGLVCDGTTMMCVAMPIVAAGQPCGNVNMVPTRCEAGAACVRAAGAQTGTCTAPAADGATCDTAAGPGCFVPAVCVPTTSGGTAGTCVLPDAMTCM